MTRTKSETRAEIDELIELKVARNWSTVEPHTIRVWAAANGVPASKKGKLARSTEIAYYRAHAGQ